MNNDFIHKEYPKTCAADDFFGQVKRTVNGKPVPQEQIDMIIASIRDGISFYPGCSLLDIGCGNGALSRYLFEDCAQFLGVDFSEYLIQVAKENFEKLPAYEFTEMDAASYVDSERNPERFDRALCYGAFSYLSYSDAERVLKGISVRFTNIGILYIGNLPDKDRAHLFYPEGTDVDSQVSDRGSPIGIWRSREEMSRLAVESGWHVDYKTMPEDFYAAHYRYDAVLTRR